MSKIAVIDIGTNSVHMVIAEVRPDFTYKILDRFKDMARLGNGAFETQRLSEEAIARGLSVIAVATSAVREAKNGGDFIDLVREQTGLRVRVISGEEEARLIFLGIKNSVPMTEQPALAVDVGGGSVEVIAG